MAANISAGKGARTALPARNPSIASLPLGAPLKPLKRSSQSKKRGLSEKQARKYKSIMEEEDMASLNNIGNILDVGESLHPKFALAKNKARFHKKLVWYKAKKDWLNIAPIPKVNKLFKQQTRELEFIRASKMDYEMELETARLTPSQRSCRKDELKMCRAHEKMAIQLISKIQVKFKAQSKF